jgi:hypothetical protein
MNTSQDYTNLIKVCTQSKVENDIQTQNQFQVEKETQIFTNNVAPRSNIMHLYN